ncbi:MAG: class I SAM-dependent methyltransferase [Solirubrobacteraceae bacterium]|nr:class I SAM-dependent methyltransferase [Solirubrobacteraceae bacterium]
MGASERLNVLEVNEASIASAHHIHRYAFAGRLVRGLRVADLGCGVGYGSDVLAAAGAASVVGVDVDPATIAEASAEFGSDAVDFVCGDALDWVEALEPGELDAIVAFEVLEHLPDPVRLVDRLAPLAARGVRVIASVPNSETFQEENPFHLTDFGVESAHELFARIAGDVVILSQHLAEGSILLREDRFALPPASAQVELAAAERAEPEYANTFVAVIGTPGEEVEAAAARLNLVLAPNHNRYMLGLERANRELRRANLRLGRGWLGKEEAAAGSVLARLEQCAGAGQDALIADQRAWIDDLEASAAQLRVDREELLAEVERLRARLTRVEGSRSWRLTRPLRAIRRPGGR